jgi:choline monooxygenase
MSVHTASLLIDPDIARARSIDPMFYADPGTWAAVRERVFARSWQWLGDLGDVALPQSLSPRELLPGLLDEPLLLARDGDGTLRCLSNVCTHRANLLVRAPCRGREIRCGYHSRRFDLAGRMTFMPEFADACNFPTSADDLPQVPFAEWATHGFAALDPVAPVDAFLGDVRGPWLAPERCVHDPSRDHDYTIAAHWALYVENYLEGFHIPFVHAGLNQAIDYESYSTELFRYASLQEARSRDGKIARATGGSFPI